MTKLRVEVDVSELDIARIRTAMPCTITPDAYKDRRYTGSVLWLDPGANYSKATVQVKVRIENPDDYLRVEGSAQVAFLTEPPQSQDSASQAPALWIPATACIPDSSGATAKVFVVSDGRLHAKTVSTGRRSGTQIEITSGLMEGQSIAADGLDKLKDGQPTP
jgi:HlyD family secretion protein